MYLSNTNQHLRAKLSGTVATNQPEYTSSWQDITSAGMTLPMSSNAGQLNNTTGVDLVDAPSASTTRQIVHYTIYNNDTSAVTVEVYKHQAGTDRTVAMVVLQSGDTLQWSRDLGFQVLSQANQAPVTFQTFTANGTYTKPTGMKYALIACVGAGGGGGSGRRGAAASNRFGGGGGGGGAIAWRLLSASDIASTVTVTIGTGGTGGAAVTANDTNGNNGAAGGDTSFGAMVIAKGGSGALGGTATAGTLGAGGSAATGSPAYGAYQLVGANGGAGGTNTGAGVGTTGLAGGQACAGGGGGGGINTANTSATTAGAGGGIYQNGLLIAGAVAGASGTSNQSVFLSFSNSLNDALGLGTGGGGGFPPSTNAGNGGSYGAGGGGGYAQLNGTDSGKGGDGAGGLCVVMEIY